MRTLFSYFAETDIMSRQISLSSDVFISAILTILKLFELTFCSLAFSLITFLDIEVVLFKLNYSSFCLLNFIVHVDCCEFESP